MQGAAAIASRRRPEGAVAVASTGVIGVPLPMGAVMTRDRRARRTRSRPDGDVDFAQAIQTTDAFDKRACARGRAAAAAPSA